MSNVSEAQRKQITDLNALSDQNITKNQIHNENNVINTSTVPLANNDQSHIDQGLNITKTDSNLQPLARLRPDQDVSMTQNYSIPPANLTPPDVSKTQNITQNSIPGPRTSTPVPTSDGRIQDPDISHISQVSQVNMSQPIVNNSQGQMVPNVNNIDELRENDLDNQVEVLNKLFDKDGALQAKINDLSKELYDCKRSLQIYENARARNLVKPKVALRKLEKAKRIARAIGKQHIETLKRERKPFMKWGDDFDYEVDNEKTEPCQGKSEKKEPCRRKRGVEEPRMQPEPETDKSESDLEPFEPGKKRSAIYTCRFCGKEYKRERFYLLHYKNKHNYKPKDNSKKKRTP